MAGLSDRASLKAANPYKYNAGSELEDEDGLEYYNTFYRKYDAQIGRFTGIDILAEEYMGLTPYHFGANNPVMFNDPNGDRLAGLSQKGPDGNYHASWMSELMWNNRSSFNFGGDEASGGGGGGGKGSFFGSLFSQWNMQGYALEGRYWYSNRKEEANFDPGDFRITVYGNLKGGEWNTSSVNWGDGDIEGRFRYMIGNKNYLEAVNTIIKEYPKEMGTARKSDYIDVAATGRRHTIKYIQSVKGTLITYSTDLLDQLAYNNYSFGLTIRAIYHERVHMVQFQSLPTINAVGALGELNAYYAMFSNTTLPGFDKSCIRELDAINYMKSTAEMYYLQLTTQQQQDYKYQYNFIKNF